MADTVKAELSSLDKRFLNEQDPNFHFDKFFKSDFEAYLFSEFEKNENIRWYFGGKLRFIYIFRQFIGLVSGENKPSANLKNLLAYIQNSFSRLEIVFYLQKVKEWLSWHETNKYLFLQESKRPDLKSPINPLKQLYFLIDVYVSNLNSNTSGLQDEVATEIAEIIFKEAENNNLEILSKKEKFSKAIKIVDFLKGNHPIKNIKLMTKTDFTSLSKYISIFIAEGQVTVQDIIGEIPIHQGDLLYTMYLLHEVMFGKERNKDFFKFLTIAFKDLQKYKEEIESDIRSSSIYKNFSRLPSKDYQLLNSDYFK